MISTTVADGICAVTLERPEARNALTRDGLAALETAITEAPEPVVLLEGAGPAFCAGADLPTVAELTEDTAADFARLGQRVARSIEDSNAIVVAGIDGAARGGGLELALACDLRVATSEATLGEPAVAFGLFGAWGGTARLPRIVGLGNAMDLGVSGRSVDAEEALRMGLVSRVVEEPRDVALELADHPPDTVQIIADRIRDDRSSDEQEAAEASAFAELVASHREDVQALLE